jgi:peptidyl-dipeptidase Dcp
VPPFDKVQVSLFEPALEAAMAEQLAEVERIANDPAPPTFANTLAALERSGGAMDRVGAVYGVYSGNMGTPEFQAVQREMSPRLAAFNDQILQNEKLFARVAAVYEARESANLTPEQKRLAWYTYTNFVRAGAKLDAAGKKRVGEINQRLATLFTTFNQNLLADETDYVLVLEDEKDLAGLPEAVRAAAAAAAEQRGHKGKWAILNTRRTTAAATTGTRRTTTRWSRRS